MSGVYSSPTSEFYKTYLLYREYIGYKKELSYSRWRRLPERFKAAALFVQFYEQITLAWYKCKTDWSIEEEGVETINQYLLKNVRKIEEDPKRFRPAYIYTVAWNCLYCLCIDPTKNKDRYYNETSESFAVNSDDEISWFDLLGEYENIEENKQQQDLRDFFDSLDEGLQCYIAYVLGELTEVQIVRKLKHLGVIDGNTKDREYRQLVLDDLDKSARIKLKAQIEVML